MIITIFIYFENNPFQIILNELQSINTKLDGIPNLTDLGGLIQDLITSIDESPKMYSEAGENTHTPTSYHEKNTLVTSPYYDNTANYKITIHSNQLDRLSIWIYGVIDTGDAQVKVPTEHWTYNFITASPGVTFNVCANQIEIELDYLDSGYPFTVTYAYTATYTQ